DLPSERNDLYVKFKLLEKADNVSFLIAGSSRAESFEPSYVKEITGQNAFLAALGGAGLPMKLVLIRKALQAQPIKHVLYVSDFFELKDRPLDPKLELQEEMTSYIEDELPYLGTTPWTEHVLHFLDHRNLEKSFSLLKDY